MPPKAAAGAPASSAQAGQQVDISTLPAQTLLQIKKQLDDELEHLNSSFNSLRAAQQKFADCMRSIKSGVNDLSSGAQILVPLTTSLYVPGTLADNNKVIVDVGTGFFVEKTVDEARVFYEEKMRDLEKNLRDLEEVLKGKSQNLRMVEEVLRQKVIESQQQQPSSEQRQAATASA